MATYSVFFNTTATTEIYTLSLHDALPIFRGRARRTRQRAGRAAGGLPGQRVGRPAAAGGRGAVRDAAGPAHPARAHRDRKSTRLNSSHANITYAVFCLKKKTDAV